MKLMFPKYSFVGLLLTVFVLSLFFTSGLTAQTKKAVPAKKPAAKKPVTKAVSKKDQSTAKDAKKVKGKSKVAAQTTKQADKSKKDPKKIAESKKAAAERQRKEAEQRQAVLAERRRREQAAREALARRIAFERGLRTETVANIAKDITEGEDLAIRQVAVNALGSHAGSVVVMEAQTGRILTIVNQDWAVRTSIRPCSTIKLVTAAAGLNEGVISPEDGSVKNTATRRMLDDALAYSDNPYFQRAGAKMGNTKLVEYGKHLGLGEPTGINLEGETAGRLPVSNSNARIYSHGDDTEVSTIQLAVMAAAITNGGNRVLPRIPRNNIEKAKFQTFYKAKVEVPQLSVRRVIPGMMGAAEYGTARRNMDQTLGVAGKTGSCIDKGSWVGLFTSVAPIESPKYAVAVITRGPSERGRHAAAVAGQIYRALAPQIVRTDRNLAHTEFKLKSKIPVEATAVTLAEDEDEEDEAIAVETNSVDMTEIETGGRNIIIVPNAPKSKKLVTKTTDSKPILPPVIITYDKEGAEKKPAPGSKPE